MTFDACYIAYAEQKPQADEIIQFWENQGYTLRQPTTNKIVVWMPGSDDFEEIDDLNGVDNIQGIILHVWRSNGDSLPIALNRRGRFYSEEYDFKGTIGDDYLALVTLLNQRVIQLTGQGKLAGILFDRRDYFLEALSE